MFNYLQVQHTKTGDVLGQTLTFSINNPDVLGMSIIVLDGQLNIVHKENWVREVTV